MNPSSSPSDKPKSHTRTAVTNLVMAMTLLVAFPFAGATQAISLSCVGGERLNDADLASGATLVVVWASWSPRSRDIVERVHPLAGRWGGQARVFTVNFQENPQAVQGFLAGRSFGVPVCLDPDGVFSKKYNIATLPGLLVVKDGQVVYHGKLSDDADRVIADLLH